MGGGIAGGLRRGAAGGVIVRIAVLLPVKPRPVTSLALLMAVVPRTDPSRSLRSRLPSLPMRKNRMQTRSEVGVISELGRLLIGPRVANLPHTAAEPQPKVRGCRTNPCSADWQSTRTLESSPQAVEKSLAIPGDFHSSFCALGAHANSLASCPTKQRSCNKGMSRPEGRQQPIMAGPTRLRSQKGIQTW
jgi:hypothetical protein